MVQTIFRIVSSIIGENVALKVVPLGLLLCWTEPVDGYEIIIGSINFLLLDDLSTIVDPNSSAFEKILAGASITPFGKVVKVGGSVFKVVCKGSDETAYFAMGIGHPLSDLLGGNYIYLYTRPENLHLKECERRKPNE